MSSQNQTLALVATSCGAMELSERQLVVGSGQELVSVVAADISPLDRQIATGRFPPAGPWPFILGLSGVVRRSDGSLAFAFVESVGGGYHRDGVHALSAVVDSNILVPLPEGLEPVIAAAGLTTLATAHSVFEDVAPIRAGDNVLVLGASGGVGRSVIAIALSKGANVIAVSRTPIHGLDERVTALGVDDFHLQVRDLTNGVGAHVIVNVLGGDITSRAIGVGAGDCKHLLLGFSAGPMMTLVAPMFLGGEHQLIGFNLLRRSPARIRELTVESLSDLAAGVYEPQVAAQVSLEHIVEAYVSSATASGRTVLVNKEI